MAKAKSTRRKEKASKNKSTKINENANSYMAKTPVWRFNRVDFEHPKWNLENCDVSVEQLYRKLKDFEGQTWQQIDKHSNGKNHFIEFSRMCKEAQERAIKLHLDQFDSLYSLRLSGTLRLFGLLDDGEYSIIWYDCDHEICPSTKRHT